MKKTISLDKDWKFVLDKDCGMFAAYGFRNARPQLVLPISAITKDLCGT